MSNSCELLTVKEVGALLKVHPRSIWRLAAAGKIPRPLRLAEKTVRWRLSDLERHIETLAGGDHV